MADTLPKPVTVFKLGGSTLDLPDLAERMRAVLSQRTQSRPLLIVGGGAAADVVRRWDAMHALGNETAHWLAIRAMALNERLVESAFENSVVVSTRAEADAAWRAGLLPILCCFEFLRVEESRMPADEQLARDWNATSDSIAAWIARRWPAAELVLMKSCAATAGGQPVDPLFAMTAVGLPRIGWVNLHDDSPSIGEWPPSEGSGIA